MLFSAAVAGRPASESELLDRAYRAAAAGNQREARTDFIAARTRCGDDLRPLRGIFFTDVRLGDLREAARVANIYSQREPNDFGFRLNEGFVLVTLHRYARASAIFDDLARSTDPRIRTVARNAKLTVTALIRARARNSTVAFANQSASLASAYAFERKNQDSKAVVAFRSYLAGSGSKSAAWLDLAYAYSRIHRPKLAIDAFEAYLRRSPNDDRARLARAYELLAAGRSNDARASFAALQASADGRIATTASRESESLATANPIPAKPAEDWLSSAYRYQKANDHAAATQAFATYLWTDPTNDRIRLAWGYEAYAGGNRTRAAEVFKSLEYSSDDAVAESARKQSEAIATTTRRGYAADAFAVVEYDSRFRDVFFDVDSRVIAPSRGIEPYGFYRLATDTRSSSTGTAPVIFNDNATVAGVGARVAIGPGQSTYSFVEVGRGLSFIGKPVSSDLRVGVASSAYATTKTGAHDSLDWNIASYSRYSGDIIGYAQATRDFALNGSRLRGVLGVRAVFDSQREYYNNIFEVQGGLQFGTPSVSLRLLGVAGSYLPFGTRTTQNRFYATFRPELVLSRYL